MRQRRKEATKVGEEPCSGPLRDRIDANRACIGGIYLGGA
jgi:hypothetical protein